VPIQTAPLLSMTTALMKSPGMPDVAVVNASHRLPSNLSNPPPSVPAHFIPFRAAAIEAKQLNEGSEKDGLYMVHDVP
jgi:hypothetical protein